MVFEKNVVILQSETKESGVLQRRYEWPLHRDVCTKKRIINFIKNDNYDYISRKCEQGHSNALHKREVERADR